MKLVMVDLDGTLINTKNINFNAYKKALGEYGYSLDYDFFCKECNGKYYMDFITRIVDKQNLFRIIHDKKVEYYSDFLDQGIVNSSLVNILEILKKEYKVTLVTTASKENTNQILEFFNIKNLFDLIITKEDVNAPKPNPEGYLKAMEYFDASPNDSIIFEDSDVGIEAAKKTNASLYIVNGYN